MTFAIGHVEGGTNAGRKVQKPAPKPWSCNCYVMLGSNEHAASWESKLQPAYMSRCPDCKTQRP